MLSQTKVKAIKMQSISQLNKNADGEKKQYAIFLLTKHIKVRFCVKA